MKFNEIQDQAAEDLKFNITSIEHKALEIASLKIKYARILGEYRLELKKAIFESDIVYADRFYHHKTGSSLQIDRRDLDVFIKGDKAYQKAAAKVAIHEERVRFIDGVIKSLDNMSFNINAAVKMHVFKGGGE